MTRGRFITLEGIEGAGKSTVAAALASTLRARGLPLLTTREPGGTPLAERIRALVLEPAGEPVAPVTETLLMFAARRLHVEQRIAPALARGEWVLCDRFTDATRAYQGGGRGVSAELIETLANAVHPDTTPDLTVFLDVPVAVGLARAASRRGVADRFESEAAAFFERVRARYVAIAAAEPGRVVTIDAGQSLEAVVGAAITAVEGMDR